MKKKIAVLSVALAVVIILGGINSVFLFGTERTKTKIPYNFSITSGEEWWNTSWKYCKKIVINHSLVTSDLSDFPILIHLDSDAELSTNAQDDGGDIVFVDKYNSTVYNHEIEKYDNTSGALDSWVKITSLSSTEDTVLYMYYGNQTVDNQETKNDVWDSDFRMVHHLHENLATVSDSTSYYNNGTVNSATYNSSTSIVNGGYEFNGSQNITCGNDSSLDLTNSITLEGWVKDPPITNKQKINLKILDKKEEKKLILPGRTFKVERTIKSDKPSDIFFVAFYQPGIKIKNMKIDKNNVLSNAYVKNNPTNNVEKNIEEIRKKLPDEIQELENIAYSKKIRIKDSVTVEMFFNTNKMFDEDLDNRISYLVFYDEKSFDYETTTHLECIYYNIYKIFSHTSFFKKFIALFKEYFNDDLEFLKLKSESVIENCSERFVKNIKVRPYFEEKKVCTVNTSIPEIRYAEQVDLSSQMNSKASNIKDYKLVDKNGNDLYDTLEWEVSSNSDVEYTTEIDLKKVEYKTNVADRIDNYNGSYIEVIASKDQNFFDKDTKEYKPIDINVKSSDSDDYSFENVENTVKSFFGLDGKNLFHVNGVNLSFEIENQKKFSKNKNNSISVDNNRVIYKNYYPNVDLRFSIQKGKIIEEFLVNKPLDVTSFCQNFSFGIPSYYRFEDDGSLSFFSKDGDELITKFYPPEMWEEQNRLTLNKDIHFEIEQINDYSYRLEKKIEKEGLSWLNDKKRDYPVVVDATFSSSNPTEDGHVRYSTSSGSYDQYTSDNTLLITYIPGFPSGYIAQRAYVEWDISSVPNSASVYNTVFRYHGETAEDNTKIYDMASQPSSSSASTIFSDCGGGTAFVNDFDIASGTWQTQDLGTSADSDVESRLNDDWFAIGISRSFSCSGAIYSEDYSSSPDPSIYIYYYLTDPPTTTMDDIPATATSSDLSTITGGSTDDYEVSNVYLTIHNDTDNTYWCNCLGSNSWQASCGMGCGENHAASADDGSFNSNNEDWTWTPDCSWTDGKTYTITATARDNESQEDPTPVSDTFTYSSAASNSAPEIDETSESPTNQSTGVSTSPQCSITVSDPDSDDMMIQFWENSTGSWTRRQTNESVGDGTYRWDFTQASSGGTKYWWRVRARDLYRNVTPESYWDENNAWSNEANAYDEDTGTYASGGGDGNYLYFNLTEEKGIDCSAVRIYGCGNPSKPLPMDLIDISLYDGSSWTQIAGAQSVTDDTWVTFDNIAENTYVESARISVDNRKYTQALKEFVFVQTDENVSTYHFTTESSNNAPTIDSFSLVDEGNTGWDLDNDNFTFDCTVEDADSDSLTYLFTFSKGGTPADPTTGSYHARITGVTSENYDKTNYDLEWDEEPALLWTDYDGTVTVKMRVHDDTDYSTTVESDTFSNGIDGTPPLITDNQNGDDTWIDERTDATYDVDFSDATSGLDSIQCRDGDEPNTYHDIASVDDLESYTTDWSLDATTWSDLEEGQNDIDVRAQDEAGNTYNESLSAFYVRKDTVDPTLDSAVFTDDGYAPNWYDQGSDSQATMQVSWTETNPAYVNITVSGITDQYYNDTNPSGGMSSFNINISGESDGDYTITYKIADNASNTDTTVSGTDDEPLRLDNTGPETPSYVLCSPDSYGAGGEWDNDTTIYVNWSGEGDSGCGVEDYYMEYNDDTPEEEASGGDQQDTDTGAANQECTFYVRGKDNLGNWGTSTNDTIKIDTEDPDTAIDAIADEEEPTSIAGDGTDLTYGLVHGVNITIKNETDDTYWTGSEWSATETWISADPDDAFDSNNEGWNYDNEDGIWANSKWYVITANTSDYARNDDPSPAVEHWNISAGPSAPTVTTNASTGVEETNATLRGYLSNNGSADTTCGFRYGTTNGSYSQNFSLGVTANQTEFSNDNTSLSPGQIYYYQAWAYNSEGFANGTELMFLTKPNPASNFKAQTNSSTLIYLTWTKGTGANNTYIERNSVQNWARGDGTLVYNGTDTKYEDTGLSPGTTYYYQAWSYATWNPHQWSDSNASGSNTTKNIPVLSNENPTNQSTDISLNPTLSIQVNHSDSYKMNITWYWGKTSSCSNYIGTNTTVNNGTYYMTNNNNFSNYSTTYYWKVCVNDGHGDWTNETYYFTTIGENKAVIGKGQNAYSLEISNDGNTLYGFINGNSITTTIDTNWHYVTMTYDGTDLKIYKDGLEKNTLNIGGNINTNNLNLTIGEKLTGTLDEMRISSTARTPGWINTTYNTINYPNQFITISNQRTQSPSITNPNPSDEATNIDQQPTCNVTVSDPDGGTIDVYFYENTTGSWVLQQTNSSVDVTTPTNVIWNNYTNASNPSTKYWWSARTTDGETWTNRTYYFTTKT